MKAPLFIHRMCSFPGCRLVPRRILYHPGVVLDVIITNQDQEVAIGPESSTASSRTSVQNGAHGQSYTTRNIAGYTNHDNTQVASISQHMNNLSLSSVSTLDKSQIMQSDILEREEQRILQGCGQLPAANSKENRTGLLFQNSAIDDYIMRRLKSMDGEDIVDGDIYQMYTIRLMHQMLNRQVLLENRVQALMTQNYELHEYPIPRMFIVLPKPKRRKDKITHPLTKQFRLYFLCECGDHTAGAGRGNLPNKIHLAKHEGYDLDQPSEFFDRYGSYVLAIMKFLKYGAMAAEVVVPPFALFKVVEGLDTIQKSLKMTADTIGSLVDETIKHIQDLQGSKQNDRDTSSGPMKLDDIEALEGADLRQLQLYLNAKDKGRVLGDLFRIFTHEGHVKWVCIDHYKENYRKTAIRRLKEVLSANGGYFNEERGEVSIHLASEAAADQFYEAMVKARGVRRLYIALKWDATLSDLRKFASAITKANITRLTMTGQFLKGPVLDMINDGRRYDPILELMSNGRVQEMSLSYFDKFYQRIDVSSMLADSQLRKLELSARPYFFLPSYRYSRPLKAILLRLLKRCPCLVELYVDVSGLCEAFEDLTTAIPTLPALERMEMLNGDNRVTIRTFQCEIRSVEVSNVYMDILSSDKELLLRKGCITDLCGYMSAGDVPRLIDVMQWNPKLRNIDIECKLQDSQSIMDAIISTRERIPTEGDSSGRFQVKLRFKVGLRNTWDIILEIQDESTQPIVTSRVSMSHEAPGNGSDNMELSRAFQQFGWSITALEASYMYDDYMAILDTMTGEKGSRIVSLSLLLDPIALTDEGLDCMTRVIDRSHGLQHLAFAFTCLEEMDQQAKMERMLIRYGKRLNVVRMDGSSADVWIPKVMVLCPTRLQLPKLESFFLHIGNDVPLPSDCARWIAAMVSSPSPQKPPISSTPRSTQSAIVSTSRTTCKWSSLRTVELFRILFQFDDWKRIMNALDYSALRLLYIDCASFSMDHFKALVDGIPVITNPVGRLKMIIHSSFLIVSDSEYVSQVARLHDKVPNVIFETHLHYPEEPISLCWYR